MTTITLQKAQQDLPILVERALAGEEIVIETNDKQVRLSPVLGSPAFDAANARRRGYGAMQGKLVVGPEFFDPLSDEECGLGGNGNAGP
jgi:antitoxin (DNA-binding transcriptional repressor) of toxin-antitoxin stability system